MKRFIFILLFHPVVIAQNKGDLVTNFTKNSYNNAVFSTSTNISSISKNDFALNQKTSTIIHRENNFIQNRSNEFENKKIDFFTGYNQSLKTNNKILDYPSANSLAIYNSDKSEIIYSKQIYAGEKLINGEIKRFNKDNELIENALYENGVCKTLWQKVNEDEIHWHSTPFENNSEVLLHSSNSLFSAKYQLSNLNNSNKITTYITTSNELGTITFQSIQKNYQPNFRTITNIEFTSFNNATLRCWCKNENDEVYLQFPYASFYPSGHIQLRGNVYVNICKNKKVKPFGKWYRYDQFGNIIGITDYLSLKEGVLTITPPECEEF